MALVTTEAEPKMPIHLASYYPDSETGHSQPHFCGAHELVFPNNERQTHRTAPCALVVEDDPDIALALQDLLEFEGFHVQCASTCRQAFASIARKSFAVVLLDLGLPDGDGTSILDKLHISHPSLPVIVLTASNRDLGPIPAFARITKPWVRRDLCRLLHRALETVAPSVVS